MGRGIRRLVTLYDSLDDLLQAADDYRNNEGENDDVELDEEGQKREREYVKVCLIFIVKFSRISRFECRFAAFKILVQVIPSVRTMIEDPNTDVDVYLSQVCLRSNTLSILA